MPDVFATALLGLSGKNLPRQENFDYPFLVKIFLIHGIGHSDLDPNYYGPWKTAITSGLQSCGSRGTPEYHDFHYDDLFARHEINPLTYVAAVTEFLGSAAVHLVTDPFHKTRLFGIPDPFANLRWTAGMVAQLTVDKDLRRELRDKLAAELAAFQPDVVAAHSLGTLISYDLLRNDPRGKKILAAATYLTFGSQINNPFPRAHLFDGAITMPNVRQWFHLFNPQDRVLTADIKVIAPRFLSVLASSPAGHAATSEGGYPGYLDNPATRLNVWAALARPVGSRAFAQSQTMNRALEKKRNPRALLIGINDYPDPENALEGCVNDVFLMSALLQERGFAAENIRVVLNERATAAGIRERLAWLLEGAEDGVERVLFYSGHGAQMPGYNALETIDHVDECLVPYDFAWTRETAITDDDFYQLYVDLPHAARFYAIFDCCHSGGLTRSGARKARGITPPDDIRHRLLEWDKERQMWRERKLPALNPDFGGADTVKEQFMGANLATRRIGRAMRLRKLSKAEYDRLPPDLPQPYLPVLIEACREDELSYEYRDGATSYGAFTFALAKNLRAHPQLSFEKLVATTGSDLAALGYQQSPQLLGPRALLSHPISAPPPAAALARPARKPRKKK